MSLDEAPLAMARGIEGSLLMMKLPHMSVSESALCLARTGKVVDKLTHEGCFEIRALVW